MEKARRGDVVDRLRGRYPLGPMTPSVEPEFGWLNLSQQLSLPPINEEAAVEIVRLRDALREASGMIGAIVLDFESGHPMEALRAKYINALINGVDMINAALSSNNGEQ